MIYLSLREGEGERRLPDGRFFADYSPAELRHFVGAEPMLRVHDLWVSMDRSADRLGVSWANLLAFRTSDENAR